MARPDWRDVCAELDAAFRRRVAEMDAEDARRPARLCVCTRCGRKWRKPAAQGVKTLSLCGACRMQMQRLRNTPHRRTP